MIFLILNEFGRHIFLMWMKIQIFKIMFLTVFLLIFYETQDKFRN